MNSIAVKARVRERDGFKCTGCGMTQEEHVQRFGRGLAAVAGKIKIPKNLLSCIDTVKTSDIL